MNRRSFLQSALAMTAGGLLVPEYLLTRGRSMVTVAASAFHYLLRSLEP